MKSTLKVTIRRNQVKQLWLEGKSGPEIATILGISYQIVNKDISRLRAKGEELEYRIQRTEGEVIIFDREGRSGGDTQELEVAQAQ